MADPVEPGTRFLEGDARRSRWRVKSITRGSDGRAHAVLVREDDPDARKMVSFEQLADPGKFKRLG
ncbi:MAG: hypothetical protein FJX47_08150 [Alphaproteobacteria bacterium]|nr:hypothetical protein [Alphaproteobacteria bacterium]